MQIYNLTRTVVQLDELIIIIALDTCKNFADEHRRCTLRKRRGFDHYGGGGYRRWWGSYRGGGRGSIYSAGSKEDEQEE
jgi:hypothetical protein